MLLIANVDLDLIVKSCKISSSAQKGISCLGSNILCDIDGRIKQATDHKLCKELILIIEFKSGKGLNFHQMFYSPFKTVIFDMGVVVKCRQIQQFFDVLRLNGVMIR